jgi:hypothetical protein
MADTPIATLVDEIRQDREIAVEVMRKFGLLVSSSSTVVFNLPGQSPISLPSVPQLQAEMQSGQIGARVGSAEALINGLISSVQRLEADGGLVRSSPYWRPLDLNSNSDADLSNLLFRANLENGLRLPYDGFSVKNIDRSQVSSAARLGNWLLPNYNEVLDARFTAMPTYTSTVNVAAYPITSTITYASYYPYYYWYYGYYYGWWYYYNPSLYYYYVTRTVRTGQLTGSVVGQTLSVSSEKVLTGLKIYSVAPGTYKAAANPRVVVFESSYGRPDLSKVIALGTIRNDAAFANTVATVVSELSVDLDQPVMLRPGKSYGFAIMADARFDIAHTANTDTKGGLFYTQDYYAWEQDIAKDIAVKYVFADFGASTEILIDMPAIELSGGIASMKRQMVSEIPTGGAVDVEISINSVWTPISSVNNLSSLPPYTPARLRVKGNQNAMPLIDTVNSTITAFRPATSARFFSRDLPTSPQVKVVYELAGFDPALHTFTPRLAYGQTAIAPSVMETKISADGKVRSITALYMAPAGTTTHKHDITISTQTPASIFDVVSAVEIKA